MCVTQVAAEPSSLAERYSKLNSNKPEGTSRRVAVIEEIKKSAGQAPSVSGEPEGGGAREEGLREGLVLHASWSPKPHPS